jgi:hypothetical protein
VKSKVIRLSKKYIVDDYDTMKKMIDGFINDFCSANSEIQKYTRKQGGEITLNKEKRVAALQGALMLRTALGFRFDKAKCDLLEIRIDKKNKQLEDKSDSNLIEGETIND